MEFDNHITRNVLSSGVDNNFLILDEDSIFGINGRLESPTKIFSNNFSNANTKFRFWLICFGYLFVNGK